MARTFRNDVSLEDLRVAMERFVDERDWHRFHTPRNLLCALVGEVGELAELFQWQGEVPVGLSNSWTEKERVHLGEELSDVLLYLIRLSQQCGVDLASAALAKMERNAAKYPADKCRGSSDKYTKYIATTGDAPAATTAAAAAEPAATGFSTPSRPAPASPPQTPTGALAAAAVSAPAAVAPSTSWLVGTAALGGALLGGGLVVLSRRR